MSALLSRVIGNTSRTPLPALALVGAVEHGLPTSALDVLVKEHVLDSHELDLFIPVRTLQDRRAKGRPLPPDVSDRVVRFTKLFEFGTEALGSAEHAYRWMRMENVALGGRTPLAVAMSSEGSRLVEDILGRILHGVGY